MWTYNVTRRLFSAAGMTPIPRLIPKDEDAAIREAITRCPNTGEIYCVKTHRVLSPVPPNVRVIFSYRDVRDAVISYMRFTKCTFEMALHVARAMMDESEHYLRHKTSNVLPVRYDNIVNSAFSTVGNISTFLGLVVPEIRCREIADDLQRDKVVGYLRQLQAINPNDSETADVSSASYPAVRNFDGTYRALDPATGFQTNHIGPGQDGEWRTVLSAQERQTLLSLTSEWLARHGFPP
jgi:hypothetical protein